METRPLGATGLRTSALGLGTAAIAMGYGAPRGERPAPPRASALATIERALERGVRYLDTAPAYGDAEAMLGEIGIPAGCLLATKLAIPAQGWRALGEQAARDHVLASAEASMRAVRRDVLDVLQVHNLTGADATHEPLVAALGELRATGAVRALGATVYGEDAALAAVPAFDVVQVAMNALDRRAEHHVVPAARESGTAIVVRSSLMRGVLSGAGARLDGPFEPLRAAADGFRRAAAASWAELPGAAVAWALARPSVACVLVGPRDPQELDQLIDGAGAFSGAVPDGDWGARLPADLLDPTRWPALERSP